MTAPENFFSDKWPQANKFTTENAKEFNAITTKIYSDVSRENLKVIQEYTQSCAEQFQELSHAKGLDDVVRIQTQWSMQMTPKLTQYSQNILNMIMEGATEYQKLFEKRLADLENQYKTAK